MKNIARGALTGIAIGGFVAAVSVANGLAMEAFWNLNQLAAEMIVAIAKIPFEQMIRERQQRQARLAEN